MLQNCGDIALTSLLIVLSGTQLATFLTPVANLLVAERVKSIFVFNFYFHKPELQNSFLLLAQCCVYLLDILVYAR